MISKSFVNINRLLDYLETEVSAIEKNWSSEEQDIMARISTESYLTGNKEMIFQVPVNLLKFLSPKEKRLFWKILYVLAIHHNQSIFGLYFHDFDQILNKRFLPNDLEIQVFQSHQEQIRLKEFDLSLENRGNEIYGMLNSPKYINISGRSSTIPLKKYLIILMPRMKYFDKIQSKRPQRKRGYNDHGSLGSEFSRSQMQQSRDWSLRLIEEAKAKEKSDLFALIEGFVE